MTNPLFVRGHDFIGMQGANHSWRTTEVYGTGWPSNAGGRLVGSLAGLPYALAEAEQNFLIPTQTQALIWGDLVPQMMLTARDAAILDGDTGADALGRAAHAVCRRPDRRSRDWSRRSARTFRARVYRVASPLRASQVMNAHRGGRCARRDRIADAIRNVCDRR